METPNYENHSAANAFPMMDAQRFSKIKADIAEKGQLEPITLCEGKILDGRNRHKACLELGIEPKVRHFDADPWAHAWSLNGQRRDLVQEQRYLIWKYCHENSAAWQSEKARIAEEANRKRSESAKARARNENGTLAETPPAEEKPSEEPPSEEPPAEELALEQEEEPVVQQNVAPLDETHKSEKAKASKSKTNRGAVARGDLLAKERPDLAEAVRLGTIRPAEAHRQMKKNQLAGKVAALPPDKFTVIYADPPWEYNDKQGGSISENYGAAEKHYPSMSLAELKALDIPKLAAPDCVLWLWATASLLENALELTRAWGFKYKAQFIWDKVRHNMGHYNSVRQELLLICTKGSCTPQVSKLHDSVQTIERTEHSRKPEEFRTIIDTIYPHGKRIELFCRGEAPGEWETWGNEAGHQQTRINKEAK